MEPTNALAFKIEVIWHTTDNVIGFDINFYFINLFKQRLCSIIFTMPLVYVERRYTLSRVYVTQKVYFHLLIYMQLRFITYLQIIYLLKGEVYQLWASW